MGQKGLSLTHFEFRVFLANDVHAAFAAYDFAVFAAFFDGCSNFHRGLSDLVGKAFLGVHNLRCVFRNVYL